MNVKCPRSARLGTLDERARLRINGTSTSPIEKKKSETVNIDPRRSVAR